MRCIRRFLPLAVSVLPLAATLLVASSARAKMIRIEDVFPPDVSVCALPPEAEAVPARGPVAPIPAPAPPENGRDLRTLRWLQVDARPLSVEIPLEIADGTVGVTLRAESPDPAWNVAVELLSESGELLACEKCEGAAIVGETRPGRGSLQFPSTDRPGGELQPGHYTFRVRATPGHPRVKPGSWSGTSGDGVTVDVLATFRSDVAVEVEHRLDLNFIYLPHCTVSAEIARTNPRFQDYLRHVSDWLAPTGIRLGEITHVDLDRPEYDIVTTWEQAGRMFRTSAEVGRPRALNVYCLQGFAEPLNPVVGLSGGVPGPLLNGTKDSGIAIRMSPFFVCSDCLGAFASLTAHEIGHYLGFYHTTESDLLHWDPVLDTPECTTGFPYGCGDFPYVMFPLIHSANVVWSPAQIAIARTHPLVRTVPVIRNLASQSADGVPAHGVPAHGASAHSEPGVVPAAAWPNPFRGSVRLEWPRSEGGSTPALDASRPGPAGLGLAVTVHDVRGRLVRHLVGMDGAVDWDGRAEDGTPVSAGIYFARLADGSGRGTTVRIVKAR